MHGRRTVADTLPDCEVSQWCQMLDTLGCVSLEEDKNQNESKNCVENDINTDPWPGYRYTGKLRPYYPLVSSFVI